MILFAKKGQAETLTLLLMCVFTTIAIIGLVAYDHYLLLINYSIDNQLQKYDLSTDVKNQITYCYGNPILFDSSVSCNIPYGETDITVRGYSLEQLGFGFCNPKTLIDKKPADYSDVISYTMTVQYQELFCPATLKVYI